MLYRYSVALFVISTIIPMAWSAPDVEHAIGQAQQTTKEMQSRTVEAFDRADTLSTSPKFLQGLSKEATKAMKDVETLPTPVLPNFPDPSAEMLQRARTDINKLLNQAQDQQQPAHTIQKTGPQLYVFVSTSMPDITLKRLLLQAGRIDGSLILRGLVDGDMAKTKEKVMQLLEADATGNTQIDGGLSIDPTLFERFDIAQVPSFVVTNTPAERCSKSGCPSTDYARLSGDTTIEYALETIAREAPIMRDSAQTILERLMEGL